MSRKNLESVIKVILIILLLSSCASSRQLGDKEIYRGAAEHFIKEGVFQGEYQVFKISKFRKLDKDYIKLFPKINKISVFSHQKKGSMVNIPTSYVEIENKLFLIYSKADHYNKNVLDKIHEYKYLDSTLIKAKLQNINIKLEDRPKLFFENSIEAVYYEVKKGVNGVEFTRLEHEP